MPFIFKIHLSSSKYKYNNVKEVTICQKIVMTLLGLQIVINHFQIYLRTFIGRYSKRSSLFPNSQCFILRMVMSIPVNVPNDSAKYIVYEK